MPKQIASFSLSKDALDNLEKTSKALGKTRSEFLEWVITEGFKWTPAVQEKIEAISKLQAKVEKSEVDKMFPSVAENCKEKKQ